MGQVLVILLGELLYVAWRRFLPAETYNWFEKDWLLYCSTLSLCWLTVLFAPYLRRNTLEAFKNYVLILFTRIISAVFLFGVLFVGLFVFLSSVDFLFDIGLDDRIVMDLFVAVTSILGTIFVLAGIPKDFDALAKSDYYPKILRILVNYILLPLVSLYFLLIYVYSAKILVTWSWPEGEVSTMVMAFIIMGIVVHFLIDTMKEKLVKVASFYHKWFFVITIPMLFVLFYAIGIRISEYGVTHGRYLVLLFGIWSLLLSIYFILSRKKDYRIVVFSAFVLVAFFAYSPLSTFKVSEWSQLNRLETFLQKYDLLQDGKVKNDQMFTIPEEEYFDFYSVVYFLTENKSLCSMSKWFDEDFSSVCSVCDNSHWYSSANIVQDYFGVDVGGYPLYSSFYLQSSGCLYTDDYNCIKDVKGYNYLADFYSGNFESSPLIFESEDFKLDYVEGKLILSGIEGTVWQEFDLQPLLQEYSLVSVQNKTFFNEDVPVGLMTFEYEGNGHKIKIILEEISAFLSETNGDEFIEIDMIIGEVYY
jgi:hypothetical protein